MTCWVCCELKSSEASDSPHWADNTDRTPGLPAAAPTLKVLYEPPPPLKTTANKVAASTTWRMQDVALEFESVSLWVEPRLREYRRCSGGSVLCLPLLWLESFSVKAELLWLTSVVHGESDAERWRWRWRCAVWVYKRTRVQTRCGPAACNTAHTATATARAPVVNNQAAVRQKYPPKAACCVVQGSACQDVYIQVIMSFFFTIKMGTLTHAESGKSSARLI